MGHKLLPIVLVLLGLSAGAAAQTGESAAKAKYYEAYHAETAEGAWARAAELYEAVLAHPDCPAELAERARERLAACLKKLGRAPATPAPEVKDHLAPFAKGKAQCTPCHIPHADAAGKQPAWAPNGPRRRPSIGFSALCLGCHDGFVERSCSSEGAGGRHHPVGIGTTSPEAGEGPGRLPLFEGKIECSTCHYSHRPEKEGGTPLLRREHTGGDPAKSKLCAACHEVGESRPRVYPPPPDRPRIVHLTSYVGAAGSGGPGNRPAGRVADVLLGRHELRRPYGVAVRSGQLLFCDLDAPGVLAFDLARGHFEGYLGGEVTESPRNLAFAPDGELVVLGAQGSVSILDRTGRPARAWARKGDGHAHGLAVSAAHVFVAEPAAHRIDVYDRGTGKLARALTVNGVAEGEAQPAWPTDLAIDPDGNLLFTDTVLLQVQRLSPAGNHLQLIAGPFARPKGIACDRAGRIHVVDAGYGDIRLFAPDGSMLLTYGERDQGDRGLQQPAQIALDYEHVELFEDRVPDGWRVEYLIVVTDQVGPRRAELFAFLDPESVPAGEAPPESNQPELPLPPDPLVAGAAAKPRSAHPLFRGRDCRRCHGRDEVVPQETNERAWGQCASCHAPGKPHDPGHGRAEAKCKHVEHGACRTCHAPHTSTHEQLLRKKAPALCLDCHQK